MHEKAEGTSAHWRHARWEAFRSTLGDREFSSIAQINDVWTADRYDEETIHAEARAVFSDLLEIAADRERGEPRGRFLLLKGGAGAGKTHLMGAFRRTVEERGAGYFAYAQMSTEVPSLRHYLLSHIVNSLQKTSAYSTDISPWMRLSNALVERACIPASEREALRNDEDYSQVLCDIRARLLDDLKPAPGRDQPPHGDFLTALLVLQRRDGNAYNAAMKYFRAEPLGDLDLQWLCSPQGLAGAGQPEQITTWLLRAVREFGGAAGGAFVLCLDQMEDLWDRNAPHQRRFPDLVSILRSLTDENRGLLVVLACLEDYYTQMRGELRQPDIDRIELSPSPATLRTERTSGEILALVRRRLDVLYAEADLPGPASEEETYYPFRREDLERLPLLRPRAILNLCHAAWRANRGRECPEYIEIDPGSAAIPPATPSVDQGQWDHRWNDFQTASSEPLPKAASDLCEILAHAVTSLGQQTRKPVSADPAGDLIYLAINSAMSLGSICDGAPQGGKLASQIDSLDTAARTANRPAVSIRSAAYPKSPTAKITKHIQAFLASGNRTVVFPEADWRAIHAWRQFAREHKDDPTFIQWAEQHQPLASIEGLRHLTRIEDIEAPPRPSNGEASGGAEPAPAPAVDLLNGVGTPDVPPSPEPTLDLARILLGESAGIKPEPVTIDIQSLPRHLAVLGGTGSGKTTAAMVILEGLLLRGVPVILVDRKGDLARYADPAARAAMPGPEGALLRESIDVALYTPGEPRGRPLALPVLPGPMPGATSQDLQTQATDAGAALASMLGYRESRAHNARRTALIAAIGVLLDLDDSSHTLERLLELINSEDPALLQALGFIDRRNLPPLVQELESFRRLNSSLLAPGAEPLSASRLFGLGEHARPGRTRLSIISTKFLGSDEVVQFWVAQLMMELARFASAHPSPTLQAIVMLDEADLYLPATGRPASKQPVENALRRFRSGGLGILLATQSPGDLDYRGRENIGTWLVGKITQRTAMEKLRPVFGDPGAAYLEKLPQHTIGEFCLIRAGLAAKVKCRRNLLATEQLSDAEILKAARDSAG